MKITACPLCGSKNVGIGGIRDGVHPHEFLKQACKNCGWTGTPLEFETEKEYEHFLNDLIKEDKICVDDYYEDPAKAAPIRRYIIRSFWTIFLFLFALVIPSIVYVLVSVVGNFSTSLGWLFAFFSLIIYIYIVWKKELWNNIKR
jgi:hypothetical protein